ncbi:autotransporter assembly complex protein TamA [Loktanella agnita]|uniref:autotransporter assembly complex protein TamA n=1 Tax=Loktanella agnita TaxID=287097 RepID=UPI003987D0D1
MNLGKATLVTIMIIGPLGLSAQDVRLRSPEARDVLNEASLLRQLRSNDEAIPQDFVAAARADYRRLLTALYAEGYYSGTISITIDGVEAANMAPLASPSSIDEVVIDVKPGPQFRFGNVAIAPLPPAATLPVDAGPRQPARSGEIGDAVRSGLSSWRELGYAKARVSSQRVVARHEDARLDVDVGLIPGPRLRFGDLLITGNEDVSTDRIREIAGLPSGETYSPTDLAAAESRLRRTGTFDSVALSEADNIGPNDTLDINAQFSESKPRRFGFGLELSSVEGLTVSSFWLHRNLLGGAERLRVDAEVAGIDGETGGTDYALRGNFTRPATFGADTDLFLRGEISREDEPDYLLDKVSTEIGLSRRITSDLTVQAAVGLLAAHEESDVGTREYVLLTLPLDATLERRDEPTDATEGYYLDGSVTPFVSLRGDVDGAQFFGDARGYYTIGETLPLTFAVRGQVGSLLAAGLDEAPADFLFYSGGGGTVRGQPYKSLGIDRIEDGENVTTGGTSFAGAQLEARIGIRDNIGLVAFYDIGHIGETAVPLEDGDWHAGAGIGLRYDTGIGPIRLDLGTPASGDDAWEEVQIYIGIGQAF